MDELGLSDQENNDLYEHFRFIVDKGQSLIRIDKYLTQKIENVSRNRIQTSAEAGNIFVNAKSIKSNYRVKPNDIITILLAHPPRNTEILPEDIPINVVFEDRDLLVVNKSPGMVVHPGHGNFDGTLQNAVLFYLQSETDETRRIPYLVHRIDKDTSGLLLIAKDEWVQSRLARQFFDHSVKRAYYALVWGDFKEESGTVKGHIGRSQKNRLEMDVYPEGEHGKHAITHYEVKERFGYVTLVECRLETGRTHQIRAHMRYIGHPIFNDELYGGHKILKGTIFSSYKRFIENCFEIAPRQALHAKTLGFVHPVNGKELFFESSLPDDMNLLLEKWRSYKQNFNSGNHDIQE